MRSMKWRSLAMAFAACGLVCASVVLCAGPVEGQPHVPVRAATASAQESQERFLAVLRSKVPIAPIAIETDPYLRWQSGNPPAPAAGSVCGIHFESDQVHYRLATFPATAAARSAGFAVTHFAACGTCSTLQDLAVYVETPDLTAPVRSCGMKLDPSASLTCLLKLGFSPPCAKTWQYNVQNTRRHCLSICMLSWIEDEAPTRQDGVLNDCLQCDEDHSGPVFKATAGRTRRNSGIRSSIPRPDDEIAAVVHDYVPGVAPWQK